MDLAYPGLLWFDTEGEAQRSAKLASRLEDRPKKERRLFCAACRHPITHQDERIRVNGAHEHTCTNPAGFTFHIGCFREAGGCAGLGAATPEHSWFAGYAWKVAVCARCARQLGWRFEAPGDRFHGLILERLTSVAGNGGQA